MIGFTKYLLKMVKNSSKLTIKQLEGFRELIKKNFVYINDFENVPEKLSWLVVEKIYKNPKLIFHFLEFLLEEKYIDLYKEKGIVFVDDKVSWEFLLKTSSGFVKIYDWKNYSVSIAVSTLAYPDIDHNLKRKSLLIKTILDENINNFLEFKSIESKNVLQQRPLDNFMQAWISMELLFGFSLEKYKKENYGFLEGLILLVSLIDTILRYSILLTRINKRKTKKIDQDFVELFLQKDEKYLSERDIFKIAQKEVSFRGFYPKKDFFRRVNELYNYRNKAVHRYAITNFQYIEIKKIINEYKDLKDVLYKLVVKLEYRQVELGVGFLKKDELNPKSDQEIAEMVENIFETKVNPYNIVKKDPERESLFGDKYKGGVNPKIKNFIKKIDKNE